MPRLMYFLALATTSRRFADVRCSRAARPCVVEVGDHLGDRLDVVAGLDPAADRRAARPRRGPRSASRSSRASRPDEPAGGRAVDPVEERAERLGVEPLVVDRAEVAGPLEELARLACRPTRSRRSGRTAARSTSRSSAPSSANAAQDDAVRPPRRTAAGTPGCLARVLGSVSLSGPHVEVEDRGRTGRVAIRTPSSIVFASMTSSSAVRSGTRAISRRYRRVESSMSSDVVVDDLGRLLVRIRGGRRGRGHGYDRLGLRGSRRELLVARLRDGVERKHGNELRLCRLDPFGSMFNEGDQR